MTTVREAKSLASALYRFSTFWNLLLDDYQFDLDDTDSALVLTLKPQGDVQVQQFGHMLILKLAQGYQDGMYLKEPILKNAIDLPLLTALPAFEASARLRSFTKASEHLNLTQSAVSFQVRKLEAELGVALFIRGQRNLVLTPEGARLLASVEAAFDILRTERAAFAEASLTPQLVISASVSFSSRWLIPRLTRLQGVLREIDLRIDTNDRPVDLMREGVDLAIRYCKVPPADVQSERLFHEQVFPVCSAAIRDALPQPTRPEHLTGMTLLHDNMTDFSWPKWLASVGATVSAVDRGPRFSHTALAIEAAIGGQGIALGRLALAIDDLEAGRLVRPIEQMQMSQYAYYALWLDKPRRPLPISAVLDWFRNEAARTQQFGKE